MRLLFAIPHYYHPAGGAAADGREHGATGADPGPRIAALAACVSALHQLFGQPHCVIDQGARTTHPANRKFAGAVEVVVCTTRGRHLLDRAGLPADFVTHRPTDAEPLLLGFECHAALRDRLGDHDYYCYLEDDLVLRDPLFFAKLAWFTRHLGEDKVLLPNRYEVGPHPFVRRAYVDGPLKPGYLARFVPDARKAPRLLGQALGLSVAFQRAANPHAGCFFLTRRQMAAWAKAPHFLDRDTRFIGPLESAATLGLLATFQVYKPAAENAAFLEVEHHGGEFLRLIRRPPE